MQPSLYVFLSLLLPMISAGDDDYVSTGYHRSHEGGNRGTDTRLFRWVTIASGYLALLVLALSIAAGLYLLAEVAEEYSALSKKVIKYSTAVIVALHVLFLLAGLPFKQISIGLVSHAVYYSLLSNFPYTELSPTSIGAIFLVIANHFFWFRFFFEYYVPLMQITGFFLVMVWTVPLLLFCSLSLGDDVLPAGAGGEMHGQRRGGKPSMFRALYDKISKLIGNKKPAGLSKYN